MGYGSFVVPPFVLIMNLFQRARVASLPAPQTVPGSPGPLPLGKPVYLRPTIDWVDRAEPHDGKVISQVDSPDACEQQYGVIEETRTRRGIVTDKVYYCVDERG